MREAILIVLAIIGAVLGIIGGIKVAEENEQAEKEAKAK